MNTARFRRPHGVKTTLIVGEGAPDYDTLCSAIAGDLSASTSSIAVSAARLVGDLREVIQAFLDRGGTYRDVARIFEDRGIDASPDAIRVALKRVANTSRTKPAPVGVAGGPTTSDSPPQAGARLRVSPNAEQTPPGSNREVGEEPRAEPTLEHLPVIRELFADPVTSAIDPEPIRDTQAAPRRVGIGRHLD